MLRFASEASHPGDLNRFDRELSLFRSLDLRTRRPPGYPGPRGLKPPPRFFAAPPPSARRRLSLGLGAALLVGLVASTALIYLAALPAWLFRAAVAVAALAWAGHVAAVVLHNRALDGTGGR